MIFPPVQPTGFSLDVAKRILDLHKIHQKNPDMSEADFEESLIVIAENALKKGDWVSLVAAGTVLQEIDDKRKS